MEHVGISKSIARSEDGRRIKSYWERTKTEEGGILHEVLQDRDVDDVDILWCLRRAMEERDIAAIRICGYILSIDSEYERRNHLNDILGWPTP